MLKAWSNASSHRNPSIGDVMLVFIPSPIDHSPLQLDMGDTIELTLLVVLALVSVLAVVSVLAFDLTDELGDKPLLREMTGAGRGMGRGA